jgi:tRNA threonylcarbamoyladenosine biosynthesis protein TsaE
MAEHSCDLTDAAATRALGQRLGAAWLASSQQSAPPAEAGPTPLLLLLQGELGAGKTCLVQGLAEALGIDEPVTSPTFALAQHYGGRLRGGGATRLVHLDLYRLELAAAADELFAQEEEEAAALARGVNLGGWSTSAGAIEAPEREPNGIRVVLAVEWPERLSFVPREAWQLRLEHWGEGRRAHWLAPQPLGEMEPGPAG